MNALGISSVRLVTGLAAIAATGLVLAGCGTPAEDPNAVTVGLPYGATMEEYQAAFEDVDPVTLKFQASGPEGSLANEGLEAYAAALTEWSGGKIEFEWGYANAFVPAATEWALGLGDGRIDMGTFLPFYNPDIFPQLSDLTSMTFLDGNAPTSTLLSTAWTTEAVTTIPTYVDEAAAGGIHILTASPAVSIAGIFCKEDRTSLDDFEGVLISASGSGRVAELTALGFSPQSIAFTELFEALERGVVECGSTVPTALETIGATALAPYAVADPEVALSGFPSFVSINQDQWDALPPVAQQLFTDRLDVFYPNEPGGQGERVKAWLEKAIAAGGGIKPLDDDAREALIEANDTLLDQLADRGTDVEALQAIFDKWYGIINDDLYPDLSDNLEEFIVNDGYADLDYGPYVDAIFSEFYLDNRPS